MSALNDSQHYHFILYLSDKCRYVFLRIEVDLFGLFKTVEINKTLADIAKFAHFQICHGSKLRVKGLKD